VSDINHTKD